MTDTIGKIEQLTDEDRSVIAVQKAIDTAIRLIETRDAERLARWLCRQDGKPEIGEDGSPQWWEYLMTARQILGVRNG